MLFRLQKAPATFPLVTDIILASVKRQFTLVYIVGIIIFSKIRRKHTAHTKMVLTVLKEAGVSLKLKKGSFFKNCIDNLGHFIKSGRLEVDRHTSDPTRELKILKKSPNDAQYCDCVMSLVNLPPFSQELRHRFPNHLRKIEKMNLDILTKKRWRHSSS